jgi:hypothetical protein
VDFFSYQARKTKADKVEPAATASIPEIKLEQLEEKSSIEVEETTVSETFIGRLRADIRKLWGKE